MNNLNGTGQSVSQLSVRHVPSPCSRRARDDNGGKREAPFVWHYPLTQCQNKVFVNKRLRHFAILLPMNMIVFYQTQYGKLLNMMFL